MNQPERLVVMSAEQVAELVTEAVRVALQARPAADQYLDKHSAGTVGLSASGFIAHCRAGHWPVELRGRRYVARREDVQSYLAAQQRPKASPVDAAPSDPIEAALASGRLALVRR